MKDQKTVTIFRCGSFLSESQQGLDEFLSKSKQAIGGYWASTNSKAIGTGLTPTITNLLLPSLIDYEPSEREYKNKVREFFESLETDVPYKTGVTLDISLHDDSKPLSAENLPNNISDYIRYHHALGHPEVASSRELAEGNQMIKFYIHNPNSVKKTNINLREKREEALKAYLSLTKDEDKVDNVLANLGKDPKNFASLHDKLEELDKRAQSKNMEDIIKFIEVVSDKNAEIKSFINKLVFAGILKTVGTRYLVTETGKVLADDLEEMILEMEDEEKNSELIVVLKSQLQSKTIEKGKSAKKA